MERERKPFSRDRIALFSIAFSPDSQRLFTFGGSQYGLLIDARDGNIQASMEHSDSRLPVLWWGEFHPSRDLLATWGAFSTKIWDVGKGTQIHEMANSYYPRFSPKGNVLALLSWLTTDQEIRHEFVRIMALSEDSILPEAIFNIEPRGRGKSLLTFSPDGKYLACCPGSNRIMLWNTSTWKSIADLHLPERMEEMTDLQGIVFSPDSRWLAAHTPALLAIWKIEEIAGNADTSGRSLRPSSRQ
jgi:WD40 repeat protein